MSPLKKGEMMGEDTFEMYKHIVTEGTECQQSTTEDV